jgi:hypothetical protein
MGLFSRRRPKNTVVLHIYLPRRIISLSVAACNESGGKWHRSSIVRRLRRGAARAWSFFEVVVLVACGPRPLNRVDQEHWWGAQATCLPVTTGTTEPNIAPHTQCTRAAQTLAGSRAARASAGTRKHTRALTTVPAASILRIPRVPTRWAG